MNGVLLPLNRVYIMDLCPDVSASRCPKNSVAGLQKDVLIQRYRVP